MFLYATTDACTTFLSTQIPRRRDAFRVGIAYGQPRTESFGAKLEFLERGLTFLSAVHQPICGRRRRHAIHVPGSSSLAFNRDSCCAHMVTTATRNRCEGRKRCRKAGERDPARG